MVIDVTLEESKRRRFLYIGIYNFQCVVESFRSSHILLVSRKSFEKLFLNAFQSVTSY
jgi:hypothetical protein